MILARRRFLFGAPAIIAYEKLMKLSPVALAAAPIATTRFRITGTDHYGNAYVEEVEGFSGWVKVDRHFRWIHTIKLLGRQEVEIECGSTQRAIDAFVAERPVRTKLIL